MYTLIDKEDKMIKHIIKIELNNVSREEQQELKNYLENNCWLWNEEKNKE